MNKSLFPEANRPRSYPILADLKLNFWAIVAVLAAVPGHWLLAHHPEWPRPLAAAVMLVPLLPGFLWMRSLWRWINGLDEMQRLIQYEACFIALLGTLFLVTASGLLCASGAVHLPRIQFGFGWEGTFALLVLFYIAGCVFSNRRYQ